MFSNIGAAELIIIGVILVILLGSKRLIGIAKSLGEASKEIKSVKGDLRDTTDDIKNTVQDL